MARFNQWIVIVRVKAGRNHQSRLRESNCSEQVFLSRAEEVLTLGLESVATGMLYVNCMKPLAFLLIVSCFFVLGCSGPGGPAQRAGAAVDNAVYKVGEGISTVGQKIEGSANP